MHPEDRPPPRSYRKELTRNVTIDYIRHRLSVDGFEWTTCPAMPEPTHANIVMRRLGGELEDRYRMVFNEMCAHLNVTLSSAYPTFVGVTNELFLDGALWGRFVALFSFGGALASQCMNKEMPQLVDMIVNWVCTYVDENLAHWFIDHGGWDGFVDYFDAREYNIRIRKNPEWAFLKNIILGAAAGTIGLLTLAAFFSCRS